MIDDGLVDRHRLGELFAAIEPQLYRHPAVDPAALGQRVAAIVSG
jgi:hypothetical protein